VIYYDPVHDFGFLKFDPNLKRMKVTELALRPDLLALGMDIRVIGNDATAKLSISAGTISRLNRNATVYGSPYSDFNTNYIQGSAMTSGGSSGSPVININGHAVALNSGSYEGASVALFLPLEQPLKALRRIINGENVPRGTIQTWWTNRPFHECYTLGLTDAWVARVQETSPDETGMLVAKLVLPGGPAESKIEEGDILLKVNDKAITLFNDLTDCLDSNVSSTVDVVVQRGSEEVQVQLLVGDLHSITPDKYLITAGSIFHNFSYILAQQYGLKVRESGVYMCHAEGAFDLGANRNLIKSIDGKNTPDLDTLLQVLQNLAGKCWRPSWRHGSGRF
jgi:S1-C subfamily serine protease